MGDELRGAIEAGLCKRGADGVLAAPKAFGGAAIMDDKIDYLDNPFVPGYSITTHTEVALSASLTDNDAIFDSGASTHLWRNLTALANVHPIRLYLPMALVSSPISLVISFSKASSTSLLRSLKSFSFLVSPTILSPSRALPVVGSTLWNSTNCLVLFAASAMES